MVERPCRAEIYAKEHAAGRTRPACAGHPPRARADRTTDCARTGSMLPGSGKTFINSALLYTAKERRIACFAGLVAGYRSSRLRNHRGNRPEDWVESGIAGGPATSPLRRRGRTPRPLLVSAAACAGILRQ